MKKTTIKKLNDLVINYMSIMGLSDEQEDLLNENNPILIYFYNYILSNENENNIKLSRLFFYKMINESYRVYKKLDIINSNQHSGTKDILVKIIGKEESYDEFIDQIFKQFKESLFNLIVTYNGKNIEYIKIKIYLLEERMIECGKNDDFENAIKLQNKIKDLKK